jgi:hypothetical protein
MHELETRVREHVPRRDAWTVLLAYHLESIRLARSES